MAGPFFGLNLRLYANVYEKLIDTSENVGVLIRLGNSSYLTDDYSVNGGILVSTGFRTNLAVSREFKSLLPKPYSNCELDSNSPKFIQGLDLYNLKAHTEYAYTQQLCFFQCYQKHIFDKFNCTDFGFLSLFLNASSCIWDTIESRSENEFNGKFVNKYCISLCPLECDQMLYKSSLSSSKLIDNGNYMQRISTNLNLASDFVSRTLDSQTVAESIVDVNTFYESLSYTFTTESPQMDAVVLFGAIGGNLGLFLGVSVFSVCEVFEVLIEIKMLI